jgi:AAHS family 3-hydroxyphenylpropionic acid transporter
MIGLVIGAMAGGWLADRIGRKPVLLVSVVAFGVFSIGTAMSFDYQTLLIARLATGLGFGGAMPNLIAIATEISSPSKRAATVTTMFCGMPAGGAAVALITRFAGEALDWHTIFYIGGVLPLLLAPIVFFLLPETRPQPQAGADRGLLRALFGGGRAVATLLLWLVFVLTLVVLYLMLNWLPTLVIAKGLTAADGSAASLSFNLTSIAGALILGFIVDRAGFRWPLVLTYAALAATMFVLASATGLSPILVLAGLAGFLVLGAQYSLYAVAPDDLPAAGARVGRRRGRGHRTAGLDRGAAGGRRVATGGLQRRPGVRGHDAGGAVRRPGGAGAELCGAAARRLGGATRWTPVASGRSSRSSTAAASAGPPPPRAWPSRP